MTEGVVVAGISHEETPAHLRERLYLTPDEAADLARSLAQTGHEAVVLATCHRVEVYLASAGIAEALERARQALADVGGDEVSRDDVYTYTNENAADHLFRVAAGLESIVAGDIHVIAQVRRAHAGAQRTRATGPLLDRLFGAASTASKRVRFQTSLSTGSTSIPAAAIAAADSVAGPLSERRVLIIGTGEIAKVAALNVALRGSGEIVVADSVAANAHALADQLGDHAVSLEKLDSELGVADVVVAATGRRAFALTSDHSARLRARRRGRPLAVFDLALPRDVDPAFADLTGTRLWNLDDLAPIVTASGRGRRAELRRAETIVRDEAKRYEAWRRARAAAPAIIAPHSGAEQTRRSVPERHGFELAQLPPEDRGLSRGGVGRRPCQDVVHRCDVALSVPELARLCEHLVRDRARRQ